LKAYINFASFHHLPHQTADYIPQKDSHSLRLFLAIKMHYPKITLEFLWRLTHIIQTNQLPQPTSVSASHLFSA
jgi:hypothetical protein